MTKSGGERPSKATFEYLVSILQDHVWTPDTPPAVAEAATRILIARGVFERRRGSHEIAGETGALLSFPDAAGRATLAAVLRSVASLSGLGTLAHFIRGPGSKGSGAGGGPMAAERLPARDRSLAERLRWARRDLVRDIGGEETDARVVVDHVILLLDRASAPEASSVPPDEGSESAEGRIRVTLDVGERELRSADGTFPLTTDEQVTLLKHLADRGADWTGGPKIAKALNLHPGKLVARLRKKLASDRPELNELIDSGKRGYRIDPRFHLTVSP